MLRKNLFAIVYSVLLTAFTVYVLMDTFVSGIRISQIIRGLVLMEIVVKEQDGIKSIQCRRVGLMRMHP